MVSRNQAWRRNSVISEERKMRRKIEGRRRRSENRRRSSYVKSMTSPPAPHRAAALACAARIATPLPALARTARVHCTAPRCRISMAAKHQNSGKSISGNGENHQAAAWRGIKSVSNGG